MGILTFHCRTNFAAESLMTQITCLKRKNTAEYSISPWSDLCFLSISDPSVKFLKILLFIFKEGLWEIVLCLSRNHVIWKLQLWYRLNNRRNSWSEFCKSGYGTAPSCKVVASMQHLTLCTFLWFYNLYNTHHVVAGVF